MTDYGFFRGDYYIDKLVRGKDLWLIEPIIPVGGRMNVYGQPKKARKSYLMLGAAHAVSTGQPQWLGFDVPISGPVLYLQADTPDGMWAQRCRDIRSGGYDLDNVWFASLATMPYPFNINEHEEILHEMIEAVDGKPVMIIFDTAASLHTMNENATQDMTMFMQALDRAAGGMARVLVTHDRKGGGEQEPQQNEDGTDHEGGDLMRGNRGSSAVSGAVDTVIKMTPKGYMYYQGRAVGEEHKKLRFDHVHDDVIQCPHGNPRKCMGWMWNEDIAPEVEAARDLLLKHPKASERQLGRMLAKQFDLEVEAARALVRRQKDKM